LIRRELFLAAEAVLEDLEAEFGVPFRLLASSLDRFGALLVQAVCNCRIRVLLADSDAVGQVLRAKDDDNQGAKQALSRCRRGRRRELDHDASCMEAASARSAAPTRRDWTHLELPRVGPDEALKPVRASVGTTSASVGLTVCLKANERAHLGP
jgi:hypothetical protein